LRAADSRVNEGSLTPRVHTLNTPWDRPVRQRGDGQDREQCSRNHTEDAIAESHQPRSTIRPSIHSRS